MIYRVSYRNGEGTSLGSDYYGTKKEANRCLAQRRNEARREERLQKGLDEAETEEEYEEIYAQKLDGASAPGEDCLDEFETPRNKRELLALLNACGGHPDNG